ncbi:MAG: flagellar motor switch protein FliG [Acetobacteraceae bacterium]|nr:flagellar motor switch protein FliG [Acetobacteraceae bacterium]
MTEAISNTPPNLTDVEKSAVVMRLIGQDTAAQIIKFLSQPEINRLSMAMTRISTVSKSTAALILREFADLIRQDGSLDPNGGEEYLRAVLEKALGPEKADHLVGRLNQGSYGAGIDAVRWQDPRNLAEMIKTEHPQIIAMISAYLEPEQAQALMQHLPDELVEQVIPRLAVLDVLPPTAIQELSESLEQLLGDEPQQARISVGGVDVAAKILTRIGGKRAEHVLSTIGNIDPELAQMLTDRMFVFEDLFEIDDRSFQILLRSLDQKLLVSALKGAAPGLQDKVLRNLSQRAAQMLREEIEARGPMRQAEIDAARKEILKAAQALEREGKIMLRIQAELVE